jgi:BirA family biotin operon repressor/biotin-[acetyl-CoA-carboxylase] ligase
MSVILRPKLDPDQLQRVTMLAGVAVVEAISENLQYTKRQTLRLKWPNDVLLGKQKVCGVLTETIWIGNDLEAVIVGIGINVRVQFANTPLAEIATSLEDHTAQTVNRLDLVMQVLERVDHWIDHLHSPLLWATWRSYLSTIGQPVNFSTTAGKLAGIAVDADKTGALIVQDQDGRRHRVLVGDVS